MSTTATHYIKLYPKQGNLTGSPDQAYNLLSAKYFDHIIGGIGAGTIAALVTVAPGSYNLSYIYAPQVRTNLSGYFLGFVGNASIRLESSAESTSTKIFLDSSRSSTPKQTWRKPCPATHLTSPYLLWTY
jgi:hypothetical protein